VFSQDPFPLVELRENGRIALAGSQNELCSLGSRISKSWAILVVDFLFREIFSLETMPTS